MTDVSVASPSATMASPSPARPSGGRHLKRLSLGGSALTSPGSPFASPTSTSGSAPPSASRTSTPVRSHAPRNLRLSLSGGASSPMSYHSPAPSASGTPPDESPTARRGPSSAPSFRRDHARRMSSISYSSAGESPASFQTSPAVAASPVLQRAIREEHEEEEGEGDHLPQSGFLSPSRSSSAMGGQPTLTEVHSDLLSFIAKKERKCLDLREELKRHEAELAALKRKWEGIVSKSLAPPPAASASPALASSRTLAPIQTSPTLSRVSTSPQHTLDLSLLSSTFDPPIDDLDVEIGESVQAAKAWVGGVFGKVMDAVSGVEEAATPTLGTLREEEEEGGSASSEDSGKARRDSQASMASDAISDFGFSSSAKQPRSRPTSMNGVPESSSLSDLFSSSSSSKPTSANTFPPSVDVDSRLPSSPSSARNHTPQTSSAAAAPVPAHNRRRSTFDMGWSSIGKRLAAVTESDTFKGTRRATLNLVDTFERTLTETLGPLDPPPAPPLASSQSRRGAVSSPSLDVDSLDARDREEKGKPKEKWDWSAFLEEPLGASSKKEEVSTTSSATPRIGGYKRPSMTTPNPKPASTIASPTLAAPAEDEEEESTNGWGW